MSLPEQLFSTGIIVLVLTSFLTTILFKDAENIYPQLLLLSLLIGGFLLFPASLLIYIWG